MEDSQII